MELCIKRPYYISGNYIYNDRSSGHRYINTENPITSKDAIENAENLTQYILSRARLIREYTDKYLLLLPFIHSIA